jgi:diaminohydroxyphosphoribosylaminopyrimidine deaminase / 5-amino-6-(5-phosphoribosylamino)uracil reductase
MTSVDRNHMLSAIKQAKKCTPIAERIPKVGAIIAIGKRVIARGYRGTGNIHDDDHAELTAIRKVADKSQIPQATLYTTLEPCTKEVRSDPLKCCTELIKQVKFKKVFIGILDPNQGVTGKGLWDLQQHGIDVELFPPNSQNDSVRLTRISFGFNKR